MKRIRLFLSRTSKRIILPVISYSIPPVGSAVGGCTGFVPLFVMGLNGGELGDVVVPILLAVLCGVFGLIYGLTIGFIIKREFDTRFRKK